MLSKKQHLWTREFSFWKLHRVEGSRLEYCLNTFFALEIIKVQIY